MPRPHIINELVWNDRCLVAWGGLRPGGVVTVHLPLEIIPAENTYGATSACMPKAGTFCTWTFLFGYTLWAGATLCRNCFDPRSLTPKRKKRPALGFLAYAHVPDDEKAFCTGFQSEADKKEAVIHKILDLHFEPVSRAANQGRIVEV